MAHALYLIKNRNEDMCKSKDSLFIKNPCQCLANLFCFFCSVARFRVCFTMRSCHFVNVVRRRRDNLGRALRIELSSDEVKKLFLEFLKFFP